MTTTGATYVHEVPNKEDEKQARKSSTDANDSESYGSDAERAQGNEGRSVSPVSDEHGEEEGDEWFGGVFSKMFGWF